MKTLSADLVILLDLSGGMAGCIKSVKLGLRRLLENCESPHRELPAGREIRWRFKLCGYRNHAGAKEDWFVDNPFVNNIEAALAQLEAVEMYPSGDINVEAVSLLDALFKISTTDQAIGDEELTDRKWRGAGAGRRMVLFISNSIFETRMTIPEAFGGGIGDAIGALMCSKIEIDLCGICPEWEGYYELASQPDAEIDFVARLAETPALAGFGNPLEWRKARQCATDSINKLPVDYYERYYNVYLKNLFRARAIPDHLEPNRIVSDAERLREEAFMKKIAQHNDSELRRIRQNKSAARSDPHE
jgi:hypothetical protein